MASDDRVPGGKIKSKRSTNNSKPAPYDRGQSFMGRFKSAFKDMLTPSFLKDFMSGKKSASETESKLECQNDGGPDFQSTPTPEGITVEYNGYQATFDRDDLGLAETAAGNGPERIAQKAGATHAGASTTHVADNRGLPSTPGERMRFSFQQSEQSQPRFSGSRTTLTAKRTHSEIDTGTNGTVADRASKRPYVSTKIQGGESTDLRKPGFDVSAFASTNINASTSGLFGGLNASATRSPFYEGPITYGGAAAYQAKQGFNNTPTSQIGGTARSRVKPSGANVLSSTARKILEALEGAEKTAQEDSNSLNNTSLTYTPRIYKRLSVRETPSSSKMTGPPVRDLQAPVPAIHRPNYSTLVEVRHSSRTSVIGESSSDQAMSSSSQTSVSSITDVAFPDADKWNGKIRREREKRHEAVRRNLNDEDDEAHQSIVDASLSSIKLPPLQLQPLTATFSSTSMQSDKPRFSNPPAQAPLTFRSPIADQNERKTSSSDAVKKFQFSVPLDPAEGRLKSKLPSPSSYPFGLSAASTNSTSSSSVVTSTTMKPSLAFSYDPSVAVRKANAPSLRTEPENKLFEPARELKSGSVMDALRGGSSPATVPKSTTMETSTSSSSFVTSSTANIGSVSSPAANSSNSAPNNAAPSTMSLSSLFKQSSGNKWKCDTCMVDNKNEDLVCPCCSSARPSSQKPPAAVPTAVTTTLCNGSTAPNVVPLSSMFKQSADSKWTCSTCLVQNKSDVDVCPCCSSSRPSSSATSAPSTTPFTSASMLTKPASAGLQPTSTSSTINAGQSSNLPSLASVFAKKSDEWVCSCCCIKNKVSDDKCVACETPQPGKTNATPNEPAVSKPAIQISATGGFRIEGAAFGSFGSQPKVESQSTGVVTGGFSLPSGPIGFGSSNFQNPSDKGNAKTSSGSLASGLFSFGSSSAVEEKKPNESETKPQPSLFMFGSANNPPKLDSAPGLTAPSTALPSFQQKSPLKGVNEGTGNAAFGIKAALNGAPTSVDTKSGGFVPIFSVSSSKPDTTVGSIITSSSALPGGFTFNSSAAVASTSSAPSFGGFAAGQQAKGMTNSFGGFGATPGATPAATFQTISSTSVPTSTVVTSSTMAPSQFGGSVPSFSFGQPANTNTTPFVFGQSQTSSVSSTTSTGIFNTSQTPQKNSTTPSSIFQFGATGAAKDSNPFGGATTLGTKPQSGFTSSFTPSTFAPPAPPSFNISNANASSPFGGGFGAKPLEQQPKPAAFGAIGAANFGKRIYPAEDEANKSNKRAMSTGDDMQITDMDPSSAPPNNAVAAPFQFGATNNLIKPAPVAANPAGVFNFGSSNPPPSFGSSQPGFSFGNSANPTSVAPPAFGTPAAAPLFVFGQQTSANSGQQQPAGLGQQWTTNPPVQPGVGLNNRAPAPSFNFNNSAPSFNFGGNPNAVQFNAPPANPFNAAPANPNPFNPNPNPFNANPIVPPAANQNPFNVNPPNPYNAVAPPAGNRVIKKATRRTVQRK